VSPVSPVSLVMLGVLGVPFATALATILVGHRSDGVSKAIAIGGSAVGLILAWLVAIAHLGDAEPLARVFASTRSVRPPIEFACYVDPLSALMLMLATTVAFLVQVYSLGYLEHDPRYPSYAALVSLFTGAMVTVVTRRRPLDAAGRLGADGCVLLLPDRAPLGARRRPGRSGEGVPDHPHRGPRSCSSRSSFSVNASALTASARSWPRSAAAPSPGTTCGCRRR
jgi:hypothetical protein